MRSVRSAVWGEVERLLDAYSPLPSEEEALAAFRWLLATQDPLSRSQFAPGHFTASGFVLSPDRSAVLLIHHRRIDRWMQPGGHIDPTDLTPAAAARREIAEETGVAAGTALSNGLFGLAHHPIPGRSDEPSHRHYDLRFAFIAEDDRLAPTREVRDAAWARLDEVAAFDVDAETVHEVEKLRLMT